MCRKGVEDKVVKLDKYKSVMRSYNIGVDPPKCDTCTTCDCIKNQLLYTKKDKDTEKTLQLKTEKKTPPVQGRGST